MSKSFEVQVDKAVVNTQKRMMLVMQQSIANTVDIAQTPTAKGGRMRIDTGFLRASGQSSLNGYPSGPSMKPKDALKGQFDDGSKPNSDVQLTLGKMQFGSIFFYGWTANYAKYRNAYDGFLDVAVQRWQETVNAVVEEAKRRFPT